MATIRVELGGAPLDLATASAATLTIRPSELSTAVLVTKSLGSGVAAGALGYATIMLAAGDTAAIDAIGSGFWSLAVELDGVPSFVAARGTVAITGPAQKFEDKGVDQVARDAAADAKAASAPASHAADPAAHGNLARRFPLIERDDANTLIHTVCRGGEWVDLTGRAWSKIGAPTPVPETSRTPEALRLWDDTHTYELGRAGDGTTNPTTVAEQWGFIVCIPTDADVASSAPPMLIANNTGGDGYGYQLVVRELIDGTWEGVTFWASGEPLRGGALIPNVPNVICFGVKASIGRAFLKVNDNPIVYGPGPAQFRGSEVFRIGTHWDPTPLKFDGMILELFITQEAHEGWNTETVAQLVAWMESVRQDAIQSLARRGWKHLLPTAVTGLSSGQSWLNSGVETVVTA